MRRPELPALFICALVLALPAGAQQAGNAAQSAQALARAQGLLRQIGQQKQQLEIDNAKLKADMAGLEKRLRKAEMQIEETAAGLAASERTGQRTAADLARTRTRLEQTTAKLEEVVAKYKEIARTLKQTQFEKEQVEVELATTRQTLTAAEAANLELYKDNRAILGLYKNKSGWTSLLQDEPVTGIKGVEVENVIEEYEYKMYDHVLETNLDAAQTLRQQAPLTEP